jgi:hypothetical protein
MGEIATFTITTGMLAKRENQYHWALSGRPEYGFLHWLGHIGITPIVLGANNFTPGHTAQVKIIALPSDKIHAIAFIDLALDRC